VVASKTQIGIIAGGLIAFGLGLTLYKSISLGLPLVPAQYQDVWTIESKVSFEPGNEPVEVALALPEADNGWVTLNENFASSGFNFTVDTNGEDRRAVWSKVSVPDFTTTVYYKAQVYEQQDFRLSEGEPDELPESMRLTDTQRRAFELFVQNLRAQAPGDADFVSLLLQAFVNGKDNQDVQFILNGVPEGKLSAITELLRLAQLPVRKIRGIQLQDGRRRQTLSVLLEVYTDRGWMLFNPETAEAGIPEDFFIWERGDDAVLTVVGGENSSLEFALVVNSVPIRTVVSMEQRSEEFALLDFSIYALPVEQQGIFKGLLLIPVAALVVVFMRIVVGLSTSGTFMPILIALALIQTTLLVGLAMFLVVVGVGLWIRSYLSHLNLLLVSRVASVVIVVILLMAVVAILSYKMGLDQALTVTFFPTIILAWTIERMSILWEEEGGHEVLIQGGGSLLVAVLAYLVMANHYVAHLTFNFPELLLSLLGVILLMGKYTGYRLSELYRFREMKKLQ
jgi:hypothetical protein